MDALDVKIFRSLLSDNSVAPSAPQVRMSLREIARRLHADDMTVRNRFRKLQAAGLFSAWRLVINPRVFGYQMKGILVDVDPESAKRDMIHEIRAVPAVVVIANQYGRALSLLVLYDSEASLSHTVGQIAHVTHAEHPVLMHMALPEPEARDLTATDWAILRSLEKDARRSYLDVARELGLSSRTVKNRLERLQEGKMVMAWPDLNAGSVPGMIPFELLYTYAGNPPPAAVDSSMLSHFNGSCLWCRLGDPDRGSLVLVAPSIAFVQASLDWTRQLAGVADVRADLVLDCFNLSEKLREPPGTVGEGILAAAATGRVERVRA